ncbi:GNA-3 g alpha subunit GNA-3 [Fusarium sp. NRRL 52700]|nr:GNA-3 g alpha subunit GNA-3 [Fusarium sp. NRRL 52700]
MADPISIIGTAGAIANIIDVLTKTITTVCEMRQAWKIADLAVFAFENQLSLLKLALFEIQKWTESRFREQSHQLVMQVDSCVTCCRLLIAKIDGEVSQLQKTTAGDLELSSKLSFLFKTKDMEQIQRMVDQQTHTLTLLLSACNSNALEERTKILQQPKLVRALKDMDRDTASLIVHRDSDSTITATSVSSSRWSVQFAFDRELLISKVYDKWIRMLATTRRAHTHFTEDTAQRDHQQISNNENASIGLPSGHEQNTITHESASISKQTSSSSQYLEEWGNSWRRTAMAMRMEIQLLKRNPDTGEFVIQAKESQPNRSWKSLLGWSKGEVRAVILGAKSRKRVFEEMRLSSVQRGCYKVDQLRLFRPLILGTVLESVQYLAKRLLDDQKIKDPIKTILEGILIPDKEDLNFDYGFEPWLVEGIRTVISHPTTKELMADETLIFPENGEYFLKDVERVMQDDYFPTNSDAINCTTPLPDCVEAAFDTGRCCTMLVADPGNKTADWKTPFPHFERTVAIIYVFDLSSSLSEALLQYKITVNLHWLRHYSMLVIFNNFNGFAKRLMEMPLSDEFPPYTGGDNAKNSANYIISRVKHLNRAPINLDTYFIDGVYDDRNLEILAIVDDGFVSGVFNASGFL